MNIYWCPFCRKDRRFATPRELAEHVLLDHNEMLSEAGLRKFQKLCNGWDAVLNYTEEMYGVQQAEVDTIRWEDDYAGEAQRGFYRGYFTALDELVTYLTGKEPEKRWEVK